MPRGLFRAVGLCLLAPSFWKGKTQAQARDKLPILLLRQNVVCQSFVLADS